MIPNVRRDSMKRSTDRVLTTHTGSLPRPDALAQLHIDKVEGVPVDEDVFEDLVRTAVDDAVARQVAAGVDVVSDGEMSKDGYIEYIGERLSGFGTTAGQAELGYWLGDLLDFPELVEATYKDTHLKMPVCGSPIAYTGLDLTVRDIANFNATLKTHEATEAFIPSASPGVVAMFCPNRYYPRYDEYVLSLAEALNTEYKAITDAGFIVQVDAPDLAMGADFHTWMRPEIDKRGFRGLQELHIEAINVALQGIPAEQARMHLCWCNYMGPHTNEFPLRDALEMAFKANVTGILFEGANPAHAHEWELFEDFRVPDGKVLVPGVIDSKSQVVENPRLVAQRILQYARLVGQEKVIAGVDCGFGTFVGVQAVHPKVAWMKMKSLADGAAIASDELARPTSRR
jgi:5-methyltetrahydropteroyltriglutamate--homocysteine methyltransferase